MLPDKLSELTHNYAQFDEASKRKRDCSCWQRGKL